MADRPLMKDRMSGGTFFGLAILGIGESITTNFKPTYDCFRFRLDRTAS